MKTAKKYIRRRIIFAAIVAVVLIAAGSMIAMAITNNRIEKAEAAAAAAAAENSRSLQLSNAIAVNETRSLAAANVSAQVEEDIETANEAIAEAKRKAEEAARKAAEEAARKKAEEEARKKAEQEAANLNAPGSGTGTRALKATLTGGNFVASAYNGATGAANIGSYQAINSHVEAWLRVPGTNINYPVLQHPTQDHYYIDKGLNGAYSYYGVLWTPTATTFGTADSISPNTVIYGHNWKNCKWNAAPNTYYSGMQMLESLLSYHHTGWAEKYPYLYYSTPQEEMAFVIFAAFYTEGTTWYIHTNGDVGSIAAEAKARSRHIFDVDVDSSDKIVTISTCTRFYGNTDNQRFVVMARLLRPGEQIGPVSVTYNPNHQQPNVWG